MKKNNINYENRRKNEEDRKKYKEKWRRTKSFFGFFVSLQKYKLPELIVNWILFFFPIVIFIVVAIVPQNLGLNLNKKSFEGTAKALSVVTGIGVLVVIGFIAIIVAGILKGLWISQRRKGIYWPEINNSKQSLKKRYLNKFTLIKKSTKEADNDKKN